MKNRMQNRASGTILSGVALALLSLAIGQVALAQSDKSIGRSDDHRSAISTVVEELKALAAKDTNLGTELSEIAKEQDKSKTKVTEAMEKVESRSAFKTFLLGTDYKSVGAVRSEMVTTDNHIARLEKAVAKATDPAIIASLNEQLDALRVEKAKVEAFLTENESKFSLFGWFVKWFQ